MIAHVVKQSGPADLQLSSIDGNPATVSFNWNNPTPPGTYKAVFALQILFCPVSQTRACNDFLNNRNQPVTFTINVNGKPTANDQKVATEENTPVDIVLTATDPNNDKLTYVIASQPAHGSVDGEAPTLTYTPDPEYTGPDSFTFKVNDGKIDSEIATVDIAVKPLACPPTTTSEFAATATDCPPAKGDFTLDCSVGTTPPKIPIGQSQDIKCSLTSVDGFDDPVSLACNAIQVNPTIKCTTDPSSLSPPPGGNTPFNIKVETTGDTKKGSYEITVKGTSGSLSKSIKVPIECVSCFPPKVTSFSHSDKIVTSIRNEEGYAGKLKFCNSSQNWGCRISSDLYGLYNDPIKPPKIPNCIFGFGHLLHKGPCTAVDMIAYKRLYPGSDTRLPGITLEEANILLVQDIVKHELRINPTLRVQISQEEYDAIVSLSFNGGPGAGVSLINKVINNQKCSPEDIVKAFLDTANSGGSFTDRRLKEAALFNSGVYF